MRISMLGRLDADDVKKLEGEPVVLLRGSIEELRELAPLLFSDVKVVSSDTSGTPTEGSNG